MSAVTSAQDSSTCTDSSREHAAKNTVAMEAGANFRQRLFKEPRLLTIRASSVAVSSKSSLGSVCNVWRLTVNCRIALPGSACKFFSSDSKRCGSSLSSTRPSPVMNKSCELSRASLHLHCQSSYQCRSWLADARLVCGMGTLREDWEESDEETPEVVRSTCRLELIHGWRQKCMLVRSAGVPTSQSIQLNSTSQTYSVLARNPKATFSIPAKD